MVEASDSPAAWLPSIRTLTRVRRRDADRQAQVLDELFRRHERQLGQFLAQIVSDRSLADDLLQETFLAAARQGDRLPLIENPRAWLFQVARHRALHALRTRRRGWNAIVRLTRERPSDGPDPAEVVAVRDFLARHLEPSERILLVLRYVHGFQSQELAEIVGRSPEAVRQELSRTRHKLIERLDDSPKRGRRA